MNTIRVIPGRDDAVGARGIGIDCYTIIIATIIKCITKETNAASARNRGDACGQSVDIEGDVLP
jgi:hypothetical protein